MNRPAFDDMSACLGEICSQSIDGSQEAVLPIARALYQRGDVRLAGVPWTHIERAIEVICEPRAAFLARLPKDVRPWALVWLEAGGA